MQKTSLYIPCPMHTLSRVFCTCTHTALTALREGGTCTLPKLQHFSITAACLQQESKRLCLLLNCSSIKLFIYCYLTESLFTAKAQQKTMLTTDLGPAATASFSRRKSRRNKQYLATSGLREDAVC